MMGGVRAFFWVWLCAWAALYRWQANKQYDHGFNAIERGDALWAKATKTSARADDLRHPTNEAFKRKGGA